MRTLPNDRPIEPAPSPVRSARAHPSGRGPVVLRTAGALLGVLLLVTSCSSSKTTTTPSPSAATSASAASSATAASATATAPADSAAATTQITENWQKFFSPSTQIAGKTALLQNGDQLQPLLQGFASDPRVSQVSAQVTSVQFTSPTSATVTYNLSLQGQTVQPNATGQAVLENGTWKVSRATLCGLLTLAASASPGGSAGPLPGCS